MWKDVKGFEGLYQISEDGRVKSLSREVKGRYGAPRRLKERELKPWEASGYLRVTLIKDGKEYYPSIHRMVAEAFIPKLADKDCVNHKDGDKKNNNVSNLEWCSQSENLRHAFKQGLNKHKRNLTDEDVIDIVTRKFQGQRGSYVYEDYKHKISKPGFYSIWGGYNYPQIFNYVKEKLK